MGNVTGIFAQWHIPIIVKCVYTSACGDTVDCRKQVEAWFETQVKQ